MNLSNIKTILIGTILCMACLSCQPGRNGGNSKPEYLHAPFVHPGMFQSQSDLDTMRQNVARGAEPWATACKQLMAETDTTRQIKAYTCVSVGAYNANSIGGKEFSDDANAAYASALLWYITQDPAYARYAIRILDAWSGKLWSLDGNNAKLNIGLFGHKFLNAAEILKHTGSGWAEQDMRQFERMLRTVFYPTIKDFFAEANGNWDASMMATMMCMGVFLDDHDMFNRAVERFYRGEGNAGITRYIYPTGQCQEATRDWGHVQLGLGELSKAAQVAWTQGLDLYAAAEHRLARGYEYTAQFLGGEEMPAFGDISYRERGISDIYTSIHNHYAKVEGIQLPHTGALMAAHPEAAKPLGTLSATRAYDNTAGNEPTGKNMLPQEDNIRPETTGASMAGGNSIPAAEKLEVLPGEDIQAAIARAGSRWVVLKEGLHAIRQPLRLESGTKLCGEGRKSILMLQPDSIGPTIINATTDMHDIVLQNFVVEGATTAETGFDPNYERSMRLCSHAPSREGIILQSDSVHKMHGITLRNMTVRNCTKNGVYIAGARNITIAQCDLDNNGSNVVPGPYFHHNMHLSHVAQADITGSRFDSSLWGDGLHITFGSDVRIAGNEMARNALSGIYCAESVRIGISDNLMEGNNVAGVCVEQLMDACTQISISGNRIQYNGQAGIRSVGNNGIERQDNRESGN